MMKSRQFKGFTLIELMVSVGILSIIIVIFSGILSQVQKVMNSSNDSILTDTNATAACRLIRKDLSTISTKSGFLSITGGNRIAFALVGSFESVIARDGGEASSFGNDSLTDDKNWATNEWKAASVIVPGSVDGDTATGGSEDTLINSINPWLGLNLSGATIRITSGTGAGQRRTISENNITGNTLTVSSKWATNPDDTSVYIIYNQTHTVTSSTATPASLIVSPNWAIEPNDGAKYEVFFSANAGMIDYGRLLDTHSSAPNTLWRRVYLLKPEISVSGGGNIKDDMIKSTMEDAVDIYNSAPDSTPDITEPAITFPPQDAEDWWSFLVENCESFSVHWHTRPAPGDTNSADDWDADTWNQTSITVSGDDPIADWPDAIRVKFTLSSKEFEVFVAID